MQVKIATREDLSTMADLERENFGDDEAEPREAYELFLELDGRILIEYNGKKSTGMLATIPVDALLQNREQVLSLDQQSWLREIVTRGYLDGYHGYHLVHAFVSSRFSQELTDAFRNIERGVGFCDIVAKKSLLFYERLGCRRNGMIKDPYSDKMYVVLTYERI